MIRISFKKFLFVLLLIFPLFLITLPILIQNKIKISSIELIKIPIRFTNTILTKPSRRAKKTAPKYTSGKTILINDKAFNSEEMIKENERLKALLDFKKILPMRSIASQIIARDPSNWSNAIVLNKGTADGIKIDSVIISREGLAGRVIGTGKSISKAILITDFNSRVVAMVQRSRQIGVIYGLNKSICKLRFLPLDADIKIGDKVITSGLGGVYPKGFLIGEVAGLKKESDGLSLFALIKPSARLDKLEEVLVIQKQ